MRSHTYPAFQVLVVILKSSFCRVVGVSIGAFDDGLICPRSAGQVETTCLRDAEARMTGQVTGFEIRVTGVEALFQGSLQGPQGDN